MHIIKFPQVSENYVVTRVTQPKLYVGRFNVTCQCGNVSQVEPQNMIFKYMEFYCTKCGHAHKISNPAFNSDNTKTKK